MPMSIHHARTLALATNAQTIGYVAVATDGDAYIGPLLQHGLAGALSLFDLHSTESYQRDALHATYLDHAA